MLCKASETACTWRWAHVQHIPTQHICSGFSRQQARVCTGLHGLSERRCRACDKWGYIAVKLVAANGACTSGVVTSRGLLALNARAKYSRGEESW